MRGVEHRVFSCVLDEQRDNPPAHHRILLRAHATRNIRRIGAWYALQDPRMAERFLRAIDTLFHQLRESPRRWPEVTPTLRRCLLDGFPYVVFYRIDGLTIAILEVRHQRRRPRPP